MQSARLWCAKTEQCKRMLKYENKITNTRSWQHIRAYICWQKGQSLQMLKATYLHILPRTDIKSSQLNQCRRHHFHKVSLHIHRFLSGKSVLHTQSCSDKCNCRCDPGTCSAQSTSFQCSCLRQCHRIGLCIQEGIYIQEKEEYIKTQATKLHLWKALTIYFFLFTLF